MKDLEQTSAQSTAPILAESCTGLVLIKWLTARATEQTTAAENRTENVAPDSSLPLSSGTSAASWTTLHGSCVSAGSTQRETLSENLYDEQHDAGHGQVYSSNGVVSFSD